jgi:hypothetical protein
VVVELLLPGVLLLDAPALDVSDEGAELDEALELGGVTVVELLLDSRLLASIETDGGVPAPDDEEADPEGAAGAELEDEDEPEGWDGSVVLLDDEDDLSAGRDAPVVLLGPLSQP